MAEASRPSSNPVRMTAHRRTCNEKLCILRCCKSAAADLAFAGHFARLRPAISDVRLLLRLSHVGGIP